MIEPLERVISEFKKLPGIGQKTAERLIFHLLTRDSEEVYRLSEALKGLTEEVERCQVCGNFSIGDKCEICSDSQRDRKKICVVSRPWDIAKIESTHKYDGLYHVLGGLVNPIEDVSPDDLSITELIERVQDDGVQEVILALEPKTEGESTSMYIVKKLRPLDVEVSRIAQGIPVGRDLEFTDKATLGKAFEGRRGVD
ncbi:recombination mediator RecR [Candidatus Bipolaricaulota bacterium]|nr:recombination mediator RecR [Candidatus Bipolaricaulota bacterium]MCF7891078.1 recombination mediator RecR [Candidatus Bipolaricaulota bacterium]